MQMGQDKNIFLSEISTGQSRNILQSSTLSHKACIQMLLKHRIKEHYHNSKKQKWTIFFFFLFYEKQKRIYSSITGKAEMKKRRITVRIWSNDKRNQDHEAGSRDHTQSPSAPGTKTLISLDLAVVMDVPKESLLKYNRQPPVLSTEIVGAEP